MKWFKTKKDRDIEKLKEFAKSLDDKIMELEQENRALRKEANYLRVQMPIIRVNDNAIKVMQRVFIQENFIPVEALKDEIAYSLVKSVKEHIRYDIEDWEGKKALVGTLYVAAKDY